MSATTVETLETRFNSLIEFFGNQLDEISFEIEKERKQKANKALPLNEQEICKNCIHNESGYCVPFSVDIEDLMDTCEDCEVQKWK